jgi:hypothetical protein
MTRCGTQSPIGWAQGSEVVDTEDEVEAAQIDAEAGDGEILQVDAYGDVASHALAGKAIPIGYHDTQVGAVCHH